jgi:hypothetical protein
LPPDVGPRGYRPGTETPVHPSRFTNWHVSQRLFLLYAAADRTGFLVIDYVNLIIHEGGHFFFSWSGRTT